MPQNPSSWYVTCTSCSRPLPILDAQEARGVGGAASLPQQSAAEAPGVSPSVEGESPHHHQPTHAATHDPAVQRDLARELQDLVTHKIATLNRRFDALNTAMAGLETAVDSAIMPRIHTALDRLDAAERECSLAWVASREPICTAIDATGSWCIGQGTPSAS